MPDIIMGKLSVLMVVIITFAFSTIVSVIGELRFHVISNLISFIGSIFGWDVTPILNSFLIVSQIATIIGDLVYIAFMITVLGILISIILAPLAFIAGVLKSL